ncbi:MAG: DUF2922 domain-containing protein [Candidatus Alkaliphilus sp. MAG34]|nr:DUF2922 domain-containing protein [Clostridiales bacterium]
MDRYLQMVFRTNQNKKVTIKVTVPKEDLEAEEVKDVMDLIIDNNVIHAAAGDLTTIEGAFIVETDVTELDLNI